MTTLVINGKQVKVSDNFTSLSPEEQNRTVEEIAQSMGVTPQAPTPLRPAAAVAEGFDPALSAPTEPQDAGLLDTIMGYGQPVLDGAGYLAQETTRGVTNMLGTAVDLVNQTPRLLNLLPGDQGFRSMTDETYRLITGEYPEKPIAPIGGGQNLYDIATEPRDLIQQIMGAEVGDQTTDNPYLRVAGRAANEIGALLIPAGGAILAARKMGVDGARAMGGPVGDIIESAAVKPLNFVAKESAVSGGAGAGAGAAREMVSDGDPNTVTPGEAIADLFGALTGGIATQGTLLAGGALRDLFGAITGKGGSDLVKTVVADTIAREGGAEELRPGVIDTSGMAAAITNSRRVGDVVPGFVESTGDVLKNPGIQSLEYGRQSGPNAGLYNRRRSQNAEAVDAAISALAPDATPGAFREPLSMRRDAALEESNAAATAANDAFEAAAQKLQASMSGEARGQTIRGALDEALGAARAVEREAWSAVQGEADPAPLAQAFDEITNGLTLAERRAVFDLGEAIGTPGALAPEAAGGPVPSSVLDEFGKPIMKDAPAVSSMTDLAEITSLRSELLTGVRQAEANGDPNQARILGKYISALDGYLDGIPRLAEPLKAAREVSFDLNERFTRRGTPTADVLASRPSGGPVLPDSSVARRFVQPDEGQASNIDRILREGGSNADVKAALADEIKAGAQPFLQKPDQLDAYLKQYGTVFERFPDLKSELGNAAALRRSADAAASAKAATEATLGSLGKPGSSPVAKYLQYGDERAVDAMSGVVNAKDPRKAIDELMTFAGDDPQTVEGARSAFWKLMERDSKSSGATTMTASGDQSWRPASLYNFLTDPKKAAVAERLYADNPEQLDKLKAIATELRGVDLRISAKAPNTSGMPQALQGSAVLPSTETLASRSFAIQRGQVGVPYTGISVVAVMAKRAQMIGRGREFQNVLDKAIQNPDFAAFLMKKYNPANAAAMARAAKSYLGTRAAWVDEVMGGSDTGDEEDTVDTIMRDQ